MIRLYVCTLTAASIAPWAAAATITVGPGGGWDYADLQSAVSAASSGDTVLIQPGTYTGTGSSVVSLPSTPVHLQGVGDASTVIIDGEGARYGIHLPSTPGTSNISNLTVTNTLDIGIRVYASNATITDCLFTECSGSAVVPAVGASIEVTGCEFWNNVGGRGPAVWNPGASAILIDCDIHHNTSSDSAAIHHNLSGGSLHISGCDIHHNVGSSGGGVKSTAILTTITNSTFHHNETSYGGSGAYFDYAGDLKILLKPS